MPDGSKSIYRSGGGGGSKSIYGGPGASRPAVARRPVSGGHSFFNKVQQEAATRGPIEHHGVVGFLQNLSEGVANSITGFPAGVYKFATDPVGTTKAIGAYYKHYYGPFVAGTNGPSYHEALKNIYRDPLQIILDAATLGGAAAARGLALGEVGASGGKATARAALTGRTSGALRTIEHTLPSGEKIAGKTLPRNAARAARMQATSRILDRANPERTVIGEYARAANAVKREARTGVLRNEVAQVFADYLKAWRGLDRKERAAANILGQLHTKENVAAWRQAILETNHPDGKELVRVIDDPTVQKLIGEGFNNKKLSHAVETADALGRHMTDISGLDPAAAEARRFLPLRLARGARFQLDDAGEPSLVGGPSIDQLRQELGGREPTYIPHPSIDKPAGRTSGNSLGLGVPKKVSSEYRNRGVNFLTGLLAVDHEVLSHSYLGAVRKAYATDLHQRLLDAGREFSRDERIPAGWRIVRQKASERTPHTRKVAGDFLENLDESFKLTEDDPRFFAATEAEGLSEDGIRVAVPQNFADQIAGEFKRSSKALKWSLDKPIGVWRALVLNLRVGWLTNNVVGNHLLYALKNAGPDGIRSYLGMLSTTKGGGAVRRLLNTPEVRNSLTDADIRELLPELAAGTFIGSQSPRLTGKAAKAQRAAKIAGGGLAPVDRAIEGGLRRATANAVLRREWNARVVKEGRNFRQWARDALKDPKVQRHVVDEVNNTLGDFLNLSHTERTAVRSLVPFYAWYKAITKIVLKLPVDHPGRALVVNQLGQVGAEWVDEMLGALPSYLRGAIPVFGGILRSQALNPLTTPLQVAESVRALTLPGGKSYQARQLINEFNPFVSVPAEAIFNAAGGEGSKYGPVGKALVDIGGGLPQVRPFTSRPSTLYTDSGWLTELLSQAGVGYRRLNRQEAAKRAAEGK